MFCRKIYYPLFLLVIWLTASIAHGQSNSKEEAVRRGLQWMRNFTANRRKFDYICSDYVVMLNELTLREGKIARIARADLQLAFARAACRLPLVFEDNDYGAWDFLSFLGVLQAHPFPKKSFHRYFRKHLAKRLKPYPVHEFAEAVRKNDYVKLGDILIDACFVHWLEHDYPGQFPELPENLYPQYWELAKKGEFIYDDSADIVVFFDQHYYVTHLVYVQTNYGCHPFPKGKFKDRIVQYIKDNYHYSRYVEKDLDLTAEFIHCLTMLDHGDSPQVNDGVQFLLANQHEDGSWGTEEDLASDPYVQCHSTWAVSVALNAAP